MTHEYVKPKDSFSILRAEHQMAVNYQLQGMVQRAEAAGLNKDEIAELLEKKKASLADMMLMDGAAAKFLLNEYHASQANLPSNRSCG